MSESVIRAWLEIKQRRALRSASCYFVFVSATGILALVPNLAIAFGLSKLACLLIVPMSSHSNLWAGFLTTGWVVLVFIDCRRAERDDMAVIPLWLAREYFHMAPRLIFDGWQRMASAKEFSRIDTETSVTVLAFLASKTGPVSRKELSHALPSLDWEHVVSQLRCIEGTIVFRNGESVSLLAPLRIELRKLTGQRVRVEIPKEEEPEAIPVEQPQQLSPREILGVSASASAAEIKTAYRNRVKECHPDRFANLDEQSRQLAEEWTKAINAAYAELLGGRNA